jgi:hypothetical protein
MDRNKNHVSPAVDEFDNLFYPSVIVFHLDQAAEHAHAMVYVYHIISQIEGVEVVQGKLLGFFHRTAKPDAVKIPKRSELLKGWALPFMASALKAEEEEAEALALFNAVKNLKAKQEAKENADQVHK